MKLLFKKIWPELSIDKSLFSSAEDKILLIWGLEILSLEYKDERVQLVLYRLEW